MHRLVLFIVAFVPAESSDHDGNSKPQLLFSVSPATIYEEHNTGNL